MTRNAHDGARTVIYQDVVGNPDRHSLVIQGIDSVSAGEHAFFFGVVRRPFDVVHVLHARNKGAKLRFVFPALDELFYIGMFRSQHDVRNTENRVHAGREHGNGFADFRDFKGEFRPFTAANPVFLHRLNPFRPARQELQIVEKAISIVGDFEEPLLQILFDDGRITAPAQAVDNLFVSQYSVALFAPVYLSFLAVCQATLVQQLENPLRPFIIFFMARSHFAVPVIGKAEGLLLARHVFNIAERPICRRRAVFDSRVFSRHAESVVAHGMQDVVAVHAAVAGDDVANRVVADMPHMEVARRVRKHFQNIIRRLAVVVGATVCLVFQPFMLPFLFYFLGNIFFQLLMPPIAAYSGRGRAAAGSSSYYSVPVPSSQFLRSKTLPKMGRFEAFSPKTCAAEVVFRN